MAMMTEMKIQMIMLTIDSVIISMMVIKMTTKKSEKKETKIIVKN
jgi:hypothetical protein